MNLLAIFFSNSLLFSIIILALVVGCIFAYLRYKIIDQDHKINSMFSLVSSLVEEVSFLRNQIRSSGGGIMPTEMPPLNHGGIYTNIQSELIEVSDDESADEEEDEDDDDDTDDNEEEEETDDARDDVVKLFNFNLGNKYSILEKEVINISNKQEDDEEGEEEEEEEEDDADDDLNDSISDSEEQPNTKSIHLEEIIELPETEESTFEFSNGESSMDFLKTINLSTLQEENADYKKLTLQKLRTLVVEKGIVSDASKLKKNEILKLLEG